MVTVLFFERLCFKNLVSNEFCLNYEIQCPAQIVSYVFSKSWRPHGRKWKTKRTSVNFTWNRTSGFHRSECDIYVITTRRLLPYRFARNCADLPEARIASGFFLYRHWIVFFYMSRAPVFFICDTINNYSRTDLKYAFRNSLHINNNAYNVTLRW